MSLFDRQSSLLPILGRERALFEGDLARVAEAVENRVRTSSFLVLGGAGSIGRGVVKELFRRGPKRLSIVDASENDLVELVRDLRSSFDDPGVNLEALPLDVSSREFEAFFAASGGFDLVLNLAAMKHVRSEKDPFSLMRMLRTNVVATWRTLEQAADLGCGTYFGVSSDKAVRPASAMGASKRAMELCLASARERISVCSARFANVAFSNGSLLYGFERRLLMRQPLSAPTDVRRYFMTGVEAATLCLLASLDGAGGEIFIPDPDPPLEAISMRDVADRFLRANGLRAQACTTEQEARARVEELAALGAWPCWFTAGDTSGEKPLEELVGADEILATKRYDEVGVVQMPPSEAVGESVGVFVEDLDRMLASGVWDRAAILEILGRVVPEMRHLETGRFLDARM